MDFLATVEAGGETYEVAPLDTMKQFHLVRRLGPLLIPVLPLITNLWAAGEKMDVKLLMRELAIYLPDALTIFGQMDDDTANFILLTCLDALYRKQPTGNAKVRANGVLMFQDIKLPAMLQLAYEVIKANLGDFTVTGLLKESAAGTAQAN